MVSLIDSSDPGVYFTFTTRDGDRIECRCSEYLQHSFNVAFYFNNIYRLSEKFDGIVSYNQLKDCLVFYLNNWY